MSTWEETVLFDETSRREPLSGVAFTNVAVGPDARAAGGSADRGGGGDARTGSARGGGAHAEMAHETPTATNVRCMAGRNYARGSMSMPTVLRRHWLAAAGSLALGCTEGRGSQIASARRGIKARARALAQAAELPFTEAALKKARAAIAPLHARRPPSEPGDWLRDHPEPGQSFEGYLASDPTVTTEARRTIVVLPMAGLSEARQKVVDATAEYMRRHFGLPVRIAERLEATPPKWAHRENGGAEQILTRWLLEKVLPKQIPSDAAVLVAFTGTDLYPDPAWNYCFGEASLEGRVGVWSMARFGDPSASAAAAQLCLLRTMKLAVHETGHMFSLPHCTEYPCVQAGTNSLEETDRSPLWLCPQCLPKIAFATRTDPRERLRETGSFCRDHGFREEAAHFDRDLAALVEVQPGP